MRKRSKKDNVVFDTGPPTSPNFQRGAASGKALIGTRPHCDANTKNAILPISHDNM